MNVRRLLIFAPIVLFAFLLQSYFWVPTYEEQTRGNPERLTTFITASIGDASLLNPILSADTASSTIESLVYEGLIDRDEDLRFRGRVATDWEITEEAYFYVHDRAVPATAAGADGQAVAAVIRNAVAEKFQAETELRSTLERIAAIEVLPARNYTATVARPAKDGQPDAGKVEIEIRAPERIKLTLTAVDPDLFENLGRLLGPRYFTAFEPTRHIFTEAVLPDEFLRQQALRLLPATEHNPVIRFHLRPEVRFHDGHLLDAEDVRFTYQAIVDPRNLSPRVADYEPVKAVEVPDPLTVRIVYKRLYSPAIGTWAMGILPEHLLNDTALRREALSRGRDPEQFTMRDSRFNRNPVGCGPFHFRQWKSDQYIALERFEDYWEGPANYKDYVYRVIPDLLTQEMEFYAGTIDTYSVQPHQVQRLKNDPRFQSFSGTTFGYSYIGYNLRRKPFDDVRVRKALGMAIDVQKIIDYVLYGQGERITGPFVKQTDFYNHAIEPLPYDPQGALDLLAAAGWKKSPEGWLEKDGRRMEFTLITNNGNPQRKAILAIAQDAWKQLGIDVRTDLLEWSVFLQERVNKLDFDALVLGWSMGIEPDLYQIWHSSQTHPNQLNFVGFADSEADKLIIRIRQEYDHRQQVEDCHRLHRIIAAEQPYTFLYVPKWTAVLDKRIVIRRLTQQQVPVYEKIKPTPTGNYMFHFNKWIKLPEQPDFSQEG